MFRVFGTSLAAATLLASCSMISTEYLNESSDVIAEAALSYSLPMTFVDLAVIQYSTSQEYDVAGFKLDSKGDCREPDKVCSEVQVVSDPDHHYLVNFVGNPFYNDTLDLGVDSSGFLTKADGIAKDETANIIVRATRLTLGDLPKPKAYADKRGTADLVDRILLDPHNPRQLASANSRLAEYSLSLTCSGSCGLSAPPVRESDDAVYYRQPRTIFLQITDTRTGALRSVYPVHSFNGSPLIAHRFERAPFIERKTEITYAHGVPLTVKHTKPSEALGLVTGVGELAGAIIFSPLTALTSQTESINTQKANLVAREQLLDQQQKTLQAEANYRAQYGALPYTAYSDPRLADQNNRPSDQDAQSAGR